MVVDLGDPLPLIDIALPFYGDVAMMKMAVNSILAQTDGDWKLIVGDDGYPDPEVAHWFSSLNDSRILYFRNTENLGANKNFQKCLEFVTADYVVVMGADDFMHANYLEVVKSQISMNPDASLFQPKVQIINETGSIVRPLADRIKSKLRMPQGCYEGETICASLMSGNWLYFPSMVWRTKDVKSQGFRDGLHVAQDLALAIDLIIDGKSICLFDDLIFDYRRHSAGDSAVKALTGARFTEERSFFFGLSGEFKRLNWNRASLAARIHITSRLNAASLIPLAVRRRKGIVQLLKHLVL